MTESMTIDRLRQQGYAYYEGYLSFFNHKKRQKQRSAAKSLTKGDYEKRALQCWERVLQYERRPEDILLYARIQHARMGGSTRPRDLTWEQLYGLYDEAVALWDRHGRQGQEKEYMRACCGLCRCGLATYAASSALASEASLLFRPKSAVFGDAASRRRWQRMRQCMEQVQTLEDLPVTIAEGQAVPDRRRFLYSGDVYFLLGQVYDCGARLALTGQVRKTLQLAERYYRFACEIDWQRRRRKAGVSGFSYMYGALLSLYLYVRREDAFYRTWDRYHAVVDFSPAFRTLWQTRWLIVKGEYDAAERGLQLQEGTAEFPERRIQALRQLISRLRRRQ